MAFQFTFHHLDSSEALQVYTQEQLEKVGRHLLKDSRWQIHFSKGRHQCQVDISVQGPWGHFKAQASTDDFYVSVDAAAEKLGKQFLKRKQKHQHHKKPDRSREGRLERLNESLEYDNNPYFKRSAS